MTKDSSSNLILVVESGVHRTARAALAAGRTRVGAAPDNEIVLLDLGSAPTSFALDTSGDGVVLHAVATSIELPRRKKLAAGRSKRCRAGARFASHGTAFRLEGPQRKPFRPARYHLMWSVPVLAGGMFCIALLSVSASPNASPVEASDISYEATGSVPPKARDAAAGSGRPASAVLEMLREHLAATGLDSISVTARPEGSIEARGQISPQQDATWREAGRWFDGAAGGRAVLVDQVHVTAEPPPLTVQAVWPGRTPYVIDGSGDKLFVGTVLPSGWAISGIEAGQVLIRRGGQSFTVRF